jgi:hypothetical protein
MRMGFFGVIRSWMGEGSGGKPGTKPPIWGIDKCWLYPQTYLLPDAVFVSALIRYSDRSRLPAKFPQLHCSRLHHDHNLRLALVRTRRWAHRLCLHQVSGTIACGPVCRGCWPVCDARGAAYGILVHHVWATTHAGGSRRNPCSCNSRCGPLSIGWVLFARHLCHRCSRHSEISLPGRVTDLLPYSSFWLWAHLRALANLTPFISTISASHGRI